MSQRRQRFITNSDISELGDCLFCLNLIRPNSFPLIIQKALERKYITDINAYRAVKPINMILNNTTLPNQLHRERAVQGVVQLPR